MKHRRLHNVAVVVLLAFTSLAITGAVVTVWLHQTVLNTDRFVAVVSNVTADPVVIDSLSHKVTVQIVEGVSLEDRVDAMLPGPLGRLAAPLAAGLSTRMESAIETTFASEGFQSVWSRILSAAHGNLVTYLRSDTAATGGTMTIDLISLTGAGLANLQEDGALPDVVVPDVSDNVDRLTALERLGTALSTRLPPDFGQIQLTSGEKMQQLSAVVRGFDLITIGFVVFSLGLGLVTIWMVDRRWRGVLVLLVGVAVALAVLMLLLSVVSARAAEAIASPDGHVVVAAFMNRLSGSLVGWLAVVLLATLLIAGSLAVLRMGLNSSHTSAAPPPPPA